MRALSLLLGLALAAAGCGAAPEAGATADAATAELAPCLTTVLVVRHAERADEDGVEEDPPLSAAGERRARDLVEAVSAADIDAIYTTRYRRTLDTARPVAEALGLRSIPFESEAGSPEAQSAHLARHIRDRHRCETVLVVGHSNTVPAVVRALDAGEVGPIDADRYDDLFVVSFTETGTGRARLVRARYGAPSAR